MVWPPTAAGRVNVTRCEQDALPPVARRDLETLAGEAHGAGGCGFSCTQKSTELSTALEASATTVPSAAASSGEATWLVR